jgi:hypothetical protein
MKFVRVFAALIVTMGLASLSAPARAQTLTQLGSPEKVCQLTGQTDWYSGHPTNALTQTRYGLTGVDLGFPVESSNGQLLFLFGDNVPNGHPPGAYPTIPADDAIGSTTQTAEPDAKTCLDMKMASPGLGAITHPVVTPAIQQGSFNVPTGGITVNGVVYAFFWNNHCFWPDPFGPNPATPELLPPKVPPNLCFEIGTSNSLGMSVLAKASPANPTAFKQVAPPVSITYIPQMPLGFNYVTAAEPAPVHINGATLPGPFIPVFGVARYRASIPYLALAPRKTFSAFTTWHFFNGVGPNGPVWLSYAKWQSGLNGTQWAPPAHAEIYANAANPNGPFGDERCVGEHSATWNEPLKVWLLLYTCGGNVVEARTAPKPWGPWSKPTPLLDVNQTPAVKCRLLWNPPATNPPGPAPPCPANVVTQQPALLTFGYLYAPFVMTRYTKAAAPQAPAPARAATIYWLLSTWDPYQVTVMRSTLQLTP